MYFFKKKLSIKWIIFFFLFFISRIWILQNPPPSYSDVKHDYERYANMWRYGLTPYLEHYYEYPPATIPLLALPLEIDQRGIGYYYFNYRVQIFILENILFSFLLYSVYRMKTDERTKHLSISFYIIAGILAKDFWYEGIDLVFMGSFALALTSILLANQKSIKNRVVIWSLLWLSVAIKIMTAPLMLLFFLLRKIDIKKDLFANALGLSIIWGVPLVLFRSSLSVFVVFALNRPIKYGAFASYVIEVINIFTKTEHRVNLAPDFQMAGPVSDIVTKVLTIVFPLAVITLLGYVSYLWINYRKNLITAKSQYLFLLTSTFLYIYVLFLVGKTFSSPFHIWYVPLLMIYPFTLLKQQLRVYAASLYLLFIDTSYLSHFLPSFSLFNMVNSVYIYGAIKYILIVSLFVFFLTEQRRVIKKTSKNIDARL